MTQEYLKSIIKYDKDTGICTWIVQKAHRTPIGSEVGTTMKQGYRRVKINDNGYLVHRLAWLYSYGYMPKFIDHINHIKNDNRISNLREVTFQENRKNLYKYKNNKSGHTGILWREDMNKWLAQIRVNGKNIYLGCYDDINEAIKVRKEANIKYGFHTNHH